MGDEVMDFPCVRHLPSIKLLVILQLKVVSLLLCLDFEAVWFEIRARNVADLFEEKESCSLVGSLSQERRGNH